MKFLFISFLISLDILVVTKSILLEGGKFFKEGSYSTFLQITLLTKDNATVSIQGENFHFGFIYRDADGQALSIEDGRGNIFRPLDSNTISHTIGNQSVKLIRKDPKISFVNVIVRQENSNCLEMAKTMLQQVDPDKTFVKSGTYVTYRDVLKTRTACNHTYTDKWHSPEKILTLTLAHFISWVDFVDIYPEDKPRVENYESYALIFEGDSVCNYPNCLEILLHELR
jgi:hypothetical protein